MQSWQAGHSVFLFQVFLAKRGSDGDPHCVHLVLESQQAIGDALLVARQPHSYPLDVTVGGRETGRVRGWHGRGGQLWREVKVGRRENWEGALGT